MQGLSGEQRKQWDADGCLVVDDAYCGDDLRRLQAAFVRCAAKAKLRWLEEVATGTQPGAFFDIPQPLQQDEAFIGLADHPGYFGLLQDLLGENLVFHSAQVRTLPVSPVSYVGWHPDNSHDQPQSVKVQIYVDDVPADGGAFAFVPGSHKPEAGPYELMAALDRMPGHKVFPGKAGTAILFNTYGWHTSMINCTSEPRRSIILIYSEAHAAEGTEKHATFADRLNTLK